MGGERYSDPRHQRDNWRSQNTTNNGNVRERSQDPLPVRGIGQQAYRHHKRDEQRGPDAPGEKKLNATLMCGLPGQDLCFALPAP